NAVAAAFSTQSVSAEVPESSKAEEKKESGKDVQQHPVKSTTSATANLLAQLQLPPTVSAKVDKIIASGQKSRVQNINDQRARMKAHLDRQAAGVLPDDDDGHLIFKKNDTLHGRWELREELGEGTFGRVVKAYDKQKEKMRAVKIVRNVHKYRDAAYLEIKVLTKLKQLDPNGVHMTRRYRFQEYPVVVNRIMLPTQRELMRQEHPLPTKMKNVLSYGLPQ
uniref:Protein kinase domain-containing protein n=1 Tax=Angiostrongylus cantonensis TaxID=6313 RepID=A0A0K0D8X4_ANGCA